MRRDGSCFCTSCTGLGPGLAEWGAWEAPRGYVRTNITIWTAKIGVASEALSTRWVAEAQVVGVHVGHPVLEVVLQESLCTQLTLREGEHVDFVRQRRLFLAML